MNKYLDPIQHLITITEKKHYCTTENFDNFIEKNKLLPDT